MYRNHVAPRTIRHVPKDDFPIPLKNIDVQRHKNVLREVTIDDYWNMDGDKSLSEPWIGVTLFARVNKDPPEGCMWGQWRLTKKQVTTRPRNIWPEEETNMSKCLQRKAINEWADKKSWTLRENNEACTLFQTMILLMKMS